MSDAPAVAARVDGALVQASLHLDSRYLADRVLAALDVTGRGFANPGEFVHAAEAMLAAPVSAQIDFFFRMHDNDGDGRIEREELERMLHLGLAEQKLTLDEAAVERMLAAVFSEFDRDRDDQISVAELSRVLHERPELTESLVGHGIELLVPDIRGRSRPERGASSAVGWTSERRIVVAWVVGFAVANLAAFAIAFFRYRAAGANVWIAIARGCGLAINLDAALILIPMLRNLLTWLRRRPVGRYLPLDDSIAAHRLLGEVLVVLSVVHGAAHVINLGVTGRGFGTLLTGAWLTGVLLLWVIAILWVLARPWVRRKGEFELFHLSHLLYLPFFGLALLHGPLMWLWVSVPLAAYLVERVIRARRTAVKTDILAATALPAGVVRLDIRRPEGFHYEAGEYAFLLIPAISGHEWHPFTISSAPEQRELLTFHIRALGNWTSALRRLVESHHGRFRAPVRVDGPYGAPATHVDDSEHAVAIAAGIGVTPFASILRSIVMRMDDGTVALRKLPFVWIGREQESFVWFSDLLWRLEALDTRGLLDIHIYMTDARADLGGAAELARKLDHDTHGADLVTGLSSRTKFGRPDLDALVGSFAALEGLPPPKVFFCGPPVLSRALERICTTRGLTFREERF